MNKIYDIMSDVYWAIYRFVMYNLTPKYIKRKIRFFFQRLIRGWDDSETWSLGYDTFTEWIVPRLGRFMEISNTIPDNMTEEEWSEILKEMLSGFAKYESMRNGDSFDLDWSVKDQYNLDKSFKLFAKYHNHLVW